MFDSFPKDAATVLDWSWEQFKPYADDLIARELSASTLENWMQDWSSFSALHEELAITLLVATNVNTEDKVAEARYKNYLDTLYSEFQKVTNSLNKKLIDSGLKPQGFDVPLRQMESEVALFREENLPLQTELNNLNTEYDKLIGAQTVQWEGEEITLYQLAPVYQEADRSRRERAFRVAMERRMQDKDAFNTIWTRMVELRRQIARNAGFEDFRAYMWQSLRRFDYTPDDALSFFKAIEDVVVPVSERLYEKRRQRLGVETLRPWDTAVDPLGRAPLKPFKDVSELEAKVEAIFSRVDPELGAYFHIMRDEKLLDLDNRKAKAGGGYCTAFPVGRKPFIFMNAVGIHDDVQTMLHEGGHAFHVFESAHWPYFQQRHWEFVPMEFAEVGSMAMELLAGPYITQQNGGFYTDGEAARARIEHLESNITFWPYMAVVAHFQHMIYTSPEGHDPDWCDQTWLDLYRRYMRGIDITGIEDEMALWWRRQGHIFQVPFYYIEYGLAQLGAVQVWGNSLHDPAKALSQYRQALSLGGTASLPDLFSTAGARFAFDGKTLGDAVALMEKTVAELESVTAWNRI